MPRTKGAKNKPRSREEILAELADFDKRDSETPEQKAKRLHKRMPTKHKENKTVTTPQRRSTDKAPDPTPPTPPSQPFDFKVDDPGGKGDSEYYCISCEAEIKYHQRVCGNCGAKLDWTGV